MRLTEDEERKLYTTSCLTTQIVARMDKKLSEGCPKWNIAAWQAEFLWRIFTRVSIAATGAAFIGGITWFVLK